MTTTDTTDTDARRAQAGRRSNTPKIDKRRRYVFGPVPRGAEHDPDSDEMVGFAQLNEHGVAYPREYSGSYFHDTLGVTSFDDYLTRNPEALKPGRRFFFYEKADDGQMTLVFSGTMLPARAGGSLRDGEMSQPSGMGMPNGAGPIIVQASPGDRTPRSAYEDMLDTLRGELSAAREQTSQLQRRVDELQRSVIDAEQRRVMAEATLETMQQRHQAETDVLRQQHASEVEIMRQLHAKDIEILTQKAVEEATRTAQEALGDPAPSAMEQGIELLSGLAPVISPIATKLGEALGVILDEAIERRRGRHRGTTGRPVGMPPAGAPTTHDPRMQDPRMPQQAPTPAGMYEQPVYDIPQAQGVPQPRVVRHADAADVFNGGI